MKSSYKILRLMIIIAVLFSSSNASYPTKCDLEDRDEDLVARLMHTRLEFDKSLRDIEEWRREENVTRKGISDCQNIIPILKVQRNKLKADLDSENGPFHSLKESIDKQREEMRETVALSDIIPADCADVRLMGNMSTGDYTIYPTKGEKIQVQCDMETDNGGWTILLQHGNRSIDDMCNGGSSKEIALNYTGGSDFIKSLISYNSSLMVKMMDDIKGNESVHELDVFSRFFQLPGLSKNNTTVAHNYTSTNDQASGTCFWLYLEEQMKNLPNASIHILEARIRRYNYERFSFVDDEISSNQ